MPRQCNMCLHSTVYFCDECLDTVCEYYKCTNWHNPYKHDQSPPNRQLKRLLDTARYHYDYEHLMSVREIDQLILLLSWQHIKQYEGMKDYYDSDADFAGTIEQSIRTDMEMAMQ